MISIKFNVLEHYWASFVVAQLLSPCSCSSYRPHVPVVQALYQQSTVLPSVELGCCCNWNCSKHEISPLMSQVDLL